MLQLAMKKIHPRYTAAFSEKMMRDGKALVGGGVSVRRRRCLEGTLTNFDAENSMIVSLAAP